MNFWVSLETRKKIIVPIILVVMVSLTAASTLVHLLTESWWFETVGFSQVFQTRIIWQVTIWIATFLIYSLFLWFNYWLALYFTRDRAFRFLEGNGLEPYTAENCSLCCPNFDFFCFLERSQY